MKIQVKSWKKIFANHIFDKELESTYIENAQKLMRKESKGLYRQFTKKYSDNKHIKRCSPS